MATRSVLPNITFGQFIRNPIVGLMFLCILAVAYLYVDQRVSYVNRIEEQDEKINRLEVKVEQLTEQLRKSDSTLSAYTMKIRVLTEMGKIK